MQLQKQKKQKVKRLSPIELSAYKDTIYEECNGMCQLCDETPADDYHHALYGRQGADKDDRILVAICRDCHIKCHQSKHGSVNGKAKELGTNNWRLHNG